MIVATDTFYYDNKAKTVAITFENWEDSDFSQIFVEELESSAEYIPGEFYRRELPCILSILRKINPDSVDAILVDGYVYLDDFNKYGLGGYLFESLDQKTPIIGVAKTNFALNKTNKMELLRGISKNPLYITSVGIDLNVAKNCIEKMHGEFRIPKLLKELDAFTKHSNCK